MGIDATVAAKINDYNMPADHAEALRLAGYFLQEASRLFPEVYHGRLPQGDPRKSEVFRHCYKLVRETPVPADQLRLYIHAQLSVLRATLLADGKTIPLITPSVLTSATAKARWSLWKRCNDKQQVSAKPSAKDTERHVLARLRQSRLFLTTMVPATLAPHVASGELYDWVRWQQVTPHLLLLWGLPADQFDVKKLTAELTPAVRKAFQDTFAGNPRFDPR